MGLKTIRCAVPLTSSILFVLIGCSFIPLAGIQNDEALFASGIYEQSGIAQSVKIFGHRIPIMLNSYLGTLKSWVYAPIFRFWHPSPFSLRVPVVLLGGATIWLFGSLVGRIAGQRAAAAGCVLLATDTLFLITTCFDWGPVVLQHLLLASGCLLMVRFHQEKFPRWLALAFFLFGLALWDKSLFAWILSGMAIAALAVFPREVWKSFTFSNLAIASGAFCLGAAPLIFYNFCFPLETVRANAAYTADDVPGKSRLLISTLDGGGLLGYIPRDDGAPSPRQPNSALERISTRISDLTGNRRSGYMVWACLAAVLLFPLLWRTPARRPMAFALIAMTIAWLQMLFAKGAGGSVHHVILLWPFPVLLVAVAFAEASRRARRFGIPLLAAATLFFAATSLLVTNEYFTLLARNGGGVEWTDAIYPLSDSLRRVKPHAIYLDDWGLFDVLRMLNRGKLPLRVGSDPLSKPQLDPEDKRIVLDRISDTDAIFVGHVDGAELFTGVNAKLREIAASAGRRQETLASIPDQNGRPIFEVFRFVQSP